MPTWETLVPVVWVTLKLAATTTVYMVVRGTYSGGTPSAYGFLGARRRR